MANKTQDENKQNTREPQHRKLRRHGPQQKSRDLRRFDIYVFIIITGSNTSVGGLLVLKGTIRRVFSVSITGSIPL